MSITVASCGSIFILVCGEGKANAISLPALWVGARFL